MCWTVGDYVPVDNHDGGKPEPDSTKPKPKPVVAKPGKPKPKPKPRVVPTAPPTKTKKSVADQSEAERLRSRFSTRGWPGTILTSGLGDLSSLQVGGVTLGS